MSTIIDTKDGIKFFQMLSRRGALSMELRGLKRRGQSAYTICKKVYGLKGTRESVLRQMEAMVEGAQARRHNTDIYELSFNSKEEANAFAIGYNGEWIGWG